MSRWLVAERLGIDQLSEACVEAFLAAQRGERSRAVLAVAAGPAVPARAVARPGRGDSAGPAGVVADRGAHGLLPGLSAHGGLLQGVVTVGGDYEPSAGRRPGAARVGQQPPPVSTDANATPARGPTGDRRRRGHADRPDRIGEGRAGRLDPPEHRVQRDGPPGEMFPDPLGHRYNRRSQPRTVAAGTPRRAAIGRAPNLLPSPSTPRRCRLPRHDDERGRPRATTRASPAASADASAEDGTVAVPARLRSSRSRAWPHGRKPLHSPGTPIARDQVGLDHSRVHSYDEHGDASGHRQEEPSRVSVKRSSERALARSRHALTLSPLSPTAPTRRPRPHPSARRRAHDACRHQPRACSAQRGAQHTGWRRPAPPGPVTPEATLRFFMTSVTRATHPCLRRARTPLHWRRPDRGGEQSSRWLLRRHESSTPSRPWHAGIPSLRVLGALPVVATRLQRSALGEGLRFVEQGGPLVVVGCGEPDLFAVHVSLGSEGKPWPDATNSLTALRDGVGSGV